MQTVDSASWAVCTAAMGKNDGNEGISVSQISYFVGGLRGVRDHNISQEGWEDLRQGVYMGGETESQVQKRGPGGTGLFCPQVPKEEWDAAWDEIQLRQKQHQVASNLDRIERERREAHIDRLFELGFGNGCKIDRDWLRREIDNHLAQDRWEELETLLQDAHRKGLSHAVRRRDYGGTRAYLGYAVRGAEAVAELLIAVLLFVTVNSSFEKIVICLLLLIYARAADSRQNLDYRFDYLSAEMGSRFVQAYHLLKERPSKLWVRDKFAADASKVLGRAAVNSLISSLKYFMLEVFALGGLVWTLL